MIGLVEVFLLTKKLGLSEHPVGIMAMVLIAEQCIHLRCRGILYVNNNNAYIYLKIVHSQIGSGGGGGNILSVPSFGLFSLST